MQVKMSEKLLSDPFVIKYGTIVGLHRALGELFAAYVWAYPYIIENKPVPKDIIRQLVSEEFLESCLCSVEGDHVLIHKAEEQFKNNLRLKKIGTESALKQKKQRVIAKSSSNRFENRFQGSNLSNSLLARLAELGLKSGEIWANPKALENRFSSVDELNEFISMTVESPTLKDASGLNKRRYVLTALRGELGIR